MAKGIVGCDRLSNLPENIMETILMCLSTRDAARTSILSRKWRHRWAKLPRLILDENLWNNSIGKCSPRNKSIGKHAAARNIITMILHQVLLVREGPINKFTLSLPGLGNCPEIDKLMLFLLRNGIEDLTIVMWNGLYILPLSFSGCQQLRHLILESCFIGSTIEFKGFSRMISIKLRRVGVTAKVLGSLISSCPLLELLDLQNCCCGSSDIAIEIDAPNLKIFSFWGTPKSIIFVKVPNLASVSIAPIHCIGKNYSRQSEFFQHLSALEKLHLAFPMDRSLAAGEVPPRLLTTLFHLKDLMLWNVKSDELVELLFVLCLIRSSPNLQHIHIGFCTYTISITNRVLQFLDVLEENYSCVTLDVLEEVQLTDVIGTRPELELIEMLLAKSLSLKKMRIQNHSGQTHAEGSKLLEELAKFQRASIEAEIIYIDVQAQEVAYFRSM